jgi:hypothetical protein
MKKETTSKIQCRLEGTKDIVLKGIGLGGMECIDLFQDMEHGGLFEQRFMKFGKSLTLLHGVK